MAQTIDKELFKKRIKRVYAAWKNGEESLSKVDFIVITMGVDEVAYSKSTALQIWLLGVEMTDTLIVLCENGVYVLASKKKLDYMKGIDSSKEVDGVPPIKTLLRDKNDKDSSNFATIVGAMKSSRKGRTMGEISKDKFTGDFMKQWQDTIGDQFEKVDVNGALASVLAVKDEQEIGLIRKATQATMDLYNKFLKEQIIEIIDENKKVKHSKLATQTEEAMKNKKYVSGVSESDIDVCYPVIIQSGGSYALKYSIESDSKEMHFGCIVCMMGLKYRSYCSNVARTILVNPTEEMQQTYDLLLDVQDAVLAKLHAGERLSDVFEAGVAVVRAKKPQLVDKLTNSFGFATGLEFREGNLLIAGKTMATVQKGMVFNVSIGFSGLVNSAASENAGKNYALFVGDIVLTNDTEPATILTSLKKRVKHISIFLKDPNEEEEEDEDDAENKKAASEAVSKNGEILGRGARKSTVLQARTRMEGTSEEKRGHHQKDLAHKINEAAKERLKGQKSGASEKKDRRLAVSYKSILQLPKETEVLELKIFVDKKSETVIVPIYGAPVPFHISTIKNISQSVEGDYTYLRINFYHPGATLGRNEGPIFPNTDAQFLKEMTYRASNNKEPGELSAAALNLNTAFRLIKEVQKKFKTREAEEREMEDLVKQDTLVVNANRTNPKLKDLYIRPNIVSKRISGTLEAHQNGFRFTSVRGDKVDILYNNIKNAFFQPCDSEMIILLHFHLRHAILFGKKKHVDVQFYTEVGEITTDLGKHRHMHDRDDLYAEQAERDLRQKLKSAFWSFCEKVDQMTKGELEFDRPFRDLGFHGAPFRSTTLLQPTSLCLVSLTDWPPFVVNLSEVELVHFERVQFQLKNFDMVFVYKDYTRKVSMINSIPMNSLDHVKNWLDSCDIHYTEGIQSLNWVKIMKTINDDAEGFFDQGGWSFLHPESDEEQEDDDDEDEEDDAYEPSDAESGEEGSSDEESDDDDESDWEAEQSDSGSDEDLGSDESEGKDWDELEEEARRADEEDDDSGDDRRKKSKKSSSSSHKSPAKKSSSSHHSSHKSPQKSSKSASSSGRKRQNSGDSDRGAKRKKH